MTVLLASLDVLIPGTPRIEKVSVSKSIVSVPEESVAIVRAVAPATVSTYSFVAREFVPKPDLSLYPAGTVTVPVPLGERTSAPLELVVDIVLVSSVILSTFNTSILLLASTKIALDAVKVPGA